MAASSHDVVQRGRPTAVERLVGIERCDREDAERPSVGATQRADEDRRAAVRTPEQARPRGPDRAGGEGRKPASGPHASSRSSTKGRSASSTDRRSFCPRESSDPLPSVPTPARAPSAPNHAAERSTDAPVGSTVTITTASTPVSSRTCCTRPSRVLSGGASSGGADVGRGERAMRRWFACRAPSVPAFEDQPMSTGALAPAPLSPAQLGRARVLGAPPIARAGPAPAARQAWSPEPAPGPPSTRSRRGSGSAARRESRTDTER